MSNVRVRRATIEDLAVLREIWISMRLPSDDLEKRLKEFQVAETGGEVVGAVGIQFSGQYALLHSEGYSDFSFADAARQLFWDRLQTLAANHGVFRIWTQENSPFWLRWGFQPANDDILERLPAQWRNNPAPWFTLELKNEDAVAEALESKFAGFMESEKQQTARVTGQAKTLKTIIIIAGFAVFALCMGFIVYLFMHGRISLLSGPSGR